LIIQRASAGLPFVRRSAADFSAIVNAQSEFLIILYVGKCNIDIRALQVREMSKRSLLECFLLSRLLSHVFNEGNQAILEGCVQVFDSDSNEFLRPYVVSDFL
jgi:hypothetical protein